MNWREWHLFWAGIFGCRIPTSGDRAHIGNLLVTYRPETKPENFENGPLAWSTDARKIYRIGDLYIYDYGETPFEILTPKYVPEPNVINSDGLLSENKKKYSLRTTA